MNRVVFDAIAIDSLVVGELCSVEQDPHGRMFVRRRTPAETATEVLRDREADVLAQALLRVGAYPMNYPRTADGIRAWAHDHAVAGTTIDKDGD